jgi:hypothetical protein
MLNLSEDEINAEGMMIDNSFSDATYPYENSPLNDSLSHGSGKGNEEDFRIMCRLDSNESVDYISFNEGEKIRVRHSHFSSEI